MSQMNATLSLSGTLSPLSLAIQEDISGDTSYRLRADVSCGNGTLRVNVVGEHMAVTPSFVPYMPPGTGAVIGRAAAGHQFIFLFRS